MSKARKPSAKRGPGGATSSVVQKALSTKGSALESAEHGSSVPTDRRTARDRRSASDRRLHNVPVAIERRKLQRRAKVNRRRQIDPTTCERDYSLEEIEFMAALDEYKRTSGRMFPTCSEILEVLKKLGYAKAPVAEPTSNASAPAASAKKMSLDNKGAHVP